MHTTRQSGKVRYSVESRKVNAGFLDTKIMGRVLMVLFAIFVFVFGLFVAVFGEFELSLKVEQTGVSFCVALCTLLK